jgi:hypothetical protein
VLGQSIFDDGSPIPPSNAVQLQRPSILERVLYGLEFANKALLMGALNEYDEFEDRREDLPVDRPVLRISDPLKEIGYMINKLEPYRGMLIAS